MEIAKMNTVCEFCDGLGFITNDWDVEVDCLICNGTGIDTFDYDEDCPACLRNHNHSSEAHFQALDRVFAASLPEGNETEDEMDFYNANREAWNESNDYNADV